MVCFTRTTDTHFLAALQNPNYRLYFFGQLISVTGTWMQRVAQGWLVYALTQSEFWLGVIAFASGIAMLICTPFAGVIADRYPRRRVLQIAQTAEMIFVLALAGVTLAKVVQVWHVGLAAIALGITTALSEATRQAFMRDLAGKQHINSGIALNATLSNTAGILGPSFAGLLLVNTGAGWCFLFNGLSYLAVIAALGWMQLPDLETGQTKSPMTMDRFYGEVREGLGFVRHHATIAPLLLGGLISGAFGINMIMTMLPAFSADVLHSPEIGYSALNVVVSIGSVIGGILNVWLGRRFGRGQVVTTMLIILPMLSIAFTLAAALPSALGLIGLIGLGYTSFFVTTNVLIQSEVEDAYRGRVFSLWSLNRFGLSPMGALVIGSVAEITGVQITMIGCSLVAAVFGVWLLSRAVGVRNLS